MKERGKREATRGSTVVTLWNKFFVLCMRLYIQKAQQAQPGQEGQNEECPSPRQDFMSYFNTTLMLLPEGVGGVAGLWSSWLREDTFWLGNGALLSDSLFVLNEIRIGHSPFCGFVLQSGGPELRPVFTGIDLLGGECRDMNPSCVKGRAVHSWLIAADSVSSGLSVDQCLQVSDLEPGTVQQCPHSWSEGPT